MAHRETTIAILLPRDSILHRKQPASGKHFTSGLVGYAEPFYKGNSTFALPRRFSFRIRMALKVILIAATTAQVLAAILALRLNHRYRRQSAWLLVSGAALVMAIRRGTTLANVWEMSAIGDKDAGRLWTETLGT